ncbi:MAG: right-handed parallel beta-helix repeat-containing protein [Kofleriaceae bacterium]
MRNRVLALVVGVAGAAGVACGGGHQGGDGGDDGGGSTADAAIPAATCTRPALVDTSSPTTTVGDGSSTSCTAAALQAAATVGGTIVFSCGGPITITVTMPITFTKETVLDGGGTVTLSGGASSRILYLDSDYNTATPRLTVQRLSFVQGKSPMTGADTAQGGGAIYRDGGSLTVLDCNFDDNHGPMVGQDVAGGAIYGFGGGETVIAGSTFTNNSASDGGAVGSLNGDLTIIDSTFTTNAATGTGGNPGNGGCGGAIYMDGGKEAASLCGVKIQNNRAGAIGGGVFRVSNDHTGSFAMDRSTVDGNQVTPTGSGNAGGLYLEGLALAITTSTISRNQAFYNGGIWINTDTVEMSNVTIAENTAFGSNGGGMWLGNMPTGTVKNCTIANNKSSASGQVAGAIFGGGLTLVNTLIAGNSAMYTPNCDKQRTDGSGNLQFPGSAPCTTAPVVADPLLGALGDHGGDVETMVPGAGSPAKGLGTDCPPTDALGTPRPTACTAGAVEAP